MKKVNALLILGFLATLGLFTSCDPVEGDPIGPEITFQGYDGGDLTLNVGDVIEESFIVRAGDEKLENVVIKWGVGSVNETIFEADTSSIKVEDGMIVPINIVVSEAGSFVITIIATDKAAVSSTETINVTVNSIATVDKGTATLGASGASVGSFYSISDGVLNQTAAEAAATKVDFLFNYNDTDKAFIASGNEASNATVKAGAPATTLAKLDVSYAEATAADIPATMTATKLTIAIGDVIAFSNTNGSGILEVTALTESTSGTVTVSVKVKE